MRGLQARIDLERVSVSSDQSCLGTTPGNGAGRQPMRSITVAIGSRARRTLYVALIVFAIVDPGLSLKLSRWLPAAQRDCPCRLGFDFQIAQQVCDVTAARFLTASVKGNSL